MSKNSINIVPVTDTDFDEWCFLWCQYQDFYQISISDDVSELTWERFLDLNEPVHSALAWVNDQAVGMINWVYHRSTWTASDYCYLQDLIVTETFRGLSIGRSLVEYVYQHATNKGCSRVYWLTHESNTGAMKLYDKVAEQSGFIQYRKQFS